MKDGKIKFFIQFFSFFCRKVNRFRDTHFWEEKKSDRLVQIRIKLR